MQQTKLPDVQAEVTHADGHKCPRCQLWHQVTENFDGLCDRCCDVMITDWPQHEFTVEIIKSRQEQRIKYNKG